MRDKITVIGAGQIGGNIAFAIVKDNLADVVLFDVLKGVPQGKAMDITHATTILGTDSKIIGTNDYKDIVGSDVIIITASVSGRPKSDRAELLHLNAKILDSVAEGVKNYSPNAFVICITNPLDAMVSHFREKSGLPYNKVCGMAGVLDTSRFRTFIGEHFGVSTSDVKAAVIGGHGNSMVPVVSSVSIGGVSLESLITQNKISNSEVESIRNRTRMAWKEVADLMGVTAYFAPAVAAISMAHAYLKDSKSVIVCSAHCENKYGVKGTYLGVPTIIGKNGIEDILELKLSQIEKEELEHSINEINKLKDELDHALSLGA